MPPWAGEVQWIDFRRYIGKVTLKIIHIMRYENISGSMYQIEIKFAIMHVSGVPSPVRYAEYLLREGSPDRFNLLQL